MLVIVPMWSASPPESVQAFFGGTDYNRTIFNFFGPRFMIARNLPLVLALLVGWHRPKHRNALLLAVACFALGVVFTLTYIYPINTVLFEQAGGGQSAEAVRDGETMDLRGPVAVRGWLPWLLRRVTGISSVHHA